MSVFLTTAAQTLPGTQRGMERYMRQLPGDEDQNDVSMVSDEDRRRSRRSIAVGARILSALHKSKVSYRNSIVYMLIRTRD